MCTSTEGVTSSYEDGAGSNGIEQILVTAPRITFDAAVFGSIDWSEVAAQAAIGSVAGGYAAQTPGALVGALAAAAGEIEGQDGIDLVDLVDVTNDIIVVPGVPGPYIPML